MDKEKFYKEVQKQLDYAMMIGFIISSIMHNDISYKTIKICQFIVEAGNEIELNPPDFINALANWNANIIESREEQEFAYEITLPLVKGWLNNRMLSNFLGESDDSNSNSKE